MNEVPPEHPRLQALVEASRALTSELNLDRLLQRIAELSREVIGARYAAVGVLDDDGNLARFVFSGIDQETAEHIGHLPTGVGVLGAIIEENRPLRLDELSEHPRSSGFPAHHPAMHSFLGVPISGRQGAFGRLYLTEKEGGGSFSAEDEHLALMLAGQAAVAVENARLYEELSARNEQLARRMAELASFERVGRLLLAHAPIEQALRSVVEEARQLTGAHLAVFGLLDESSGAIVIRAAAGDESGNSEGLSLAPPSKAHAVMARRRAELVTDMGSDPEVVRDAWELLGRPAGAAMAPIMIAERTLGFLAGYVREPVPGFDDHDLAILQILANQAAVALENERLQAALKDLAVLEERDRIARELHDGVIQSIYSVGLSLQGSLSLLGRDPNGARVRIDEAINELDNVVRDVRSYIFELRPKVVEEKGLTRAIEELARDFEVNSLAHAQVDLDQAACEGLPPSAQVHVIQFVREALSNIARHAAASEVTVSCRRDQGYILLELEDDGAIFNPATVKRGHGLSNMEDRARKLGASLSIAPRQGKGMRHLLRIPRTDGDDV